VYSSFFTETLLLQMAGLRQAKEAALKSCSDQKRECESLTEQLNIAQQKLSTTKQQLQVGKIIW